MRSIGRPEGRYPEQRMPEGDRDLLVEELARAQSALRESEERARLTFDHAPIGEALVELDGRWRQVNPAVTRLTGYSESELLGMTFQDITHPDDLDLDLGEMVRLVAGEVPSYQIEKRYLTASGSYIWVLLSVTLVRSRDGEPMYFISQIQDISEHKRQQATMRDLIAMLAHDLRSPTTAITGFADILLTLWDTQTDEERKALIRRIATAGKALGLLLDNSVTVSTLDANGLDPLPGPVPVAEVVVDVLATVPDHELVIDLDGLHPSTAWVDRTHLTQILHNLVTNAIKYGGEALGVAARSSGDRVLVQVIDDGPGVPCDFVPHLFERFSRSNEARASTQRGSGLGLYIVKDLVTLNQGTVRYQPAAGGGSCFEVLLPAAPAAESACAG